MASRNAHRHSDHPPRRVKKLNARKYIYPLSDGTKFVIDEARRKAQIEAAGGDPNVRPERNPNYLCPTCGLRFEIPAAKPPCPRCGTRCFEGINNVPGPDHACLA